MNGAVIGRDCLVGAGAIVTEGKRFPERSLILGAPAKVVRELTEADVKNLIAAADGYVQRATVFRDELVRMGLPVAGVARMQAVAERVAATVAAGAQVVVVVSAMGDTTDDLIALAAGAASGAGARARWTCCMSTGEVVSCALLALALQARGRPGAGADRRPGGHLYRRRRIAARPSSKSIPAAARDAGRGRSRHRGRVPGRARGRPRRRGYHAGPGRLGYVRRGPGDGLGADCCEIYTDVDGIFTADPRVVPLPGSFPRIGSRRCSNWRSRARASCTRGRSSWAALPLADRGRSSFHAAAGHRDRRAGRAAAAATGPRRDIPWNATTRFAGWPTTAMSPASP